MRASKTRNYRLGKRAEQQAQTRNRIVEAALDLHSTLGPARTTVSQIAERAGVQRHTYYAHFPQDRDLFLACSALALERDPLPDVDALRGLSSAGERIRRSLEEIYWYERNAEQAACVLRDAEAHALTREMVELRMAPVFQRMAEILSEGLNQRSSALIDVALGFACWRALSRTQTRRNAAALMSDAILAI